jgi:hypothetical protein
MKSGDKIHYIPFDDCEFKDIKFGIVRGFNEKNPNTVFITVTLGNDMDLSQKSEGIDVDISRIRPLWSGIHKIRDGYIYFIDKVEVDKSYFMDTYSLDLVLELSKFNIEKEK